MKTKFSKLDTHLTRRNAKSMGTSPNNEANRSYKTTLAIAYQSSIMTQKISSVWPQIYQSQPFSGAEANVCQPIHFQNGRLVIECESPTVANHLRFNQSQLIKQLHKYEFTAITDLKLIIKHKSNKTISPASSTKNNQSLSDKNNLEGRVDNYIRTRKKPSKAVISALATCAETTHNTELRESLSRLQKQLKTR